MKNSLLLVIALIVLGGGTYLYLTMKTTSPTPAPAPTAKNSPQSEIRTTPRKQMTTAQASLIKEVALAPEVEAVLSKESGKLKTITNDSAIIAEVKAANDTDKNKTFADITALDETWIASKTVTPAIEPYLKNTTALSLLAFQKTNPNFKEIFIADAYGLNVGETNKTSDFYQADEAWWVNTMASGAGKILHGKIEFDQSAQTEAISIYLPIIDPASGKAIGVLKGVLNLSSIKGSL